MGERIQTGFFVLLLLAHLALLSQGSSAKGSRFEGYLLAVFGPLVGAVDSTVDRTSRAASDLRFASDLRRDNAALREEVEVLRREVVRLQGVEEELERLSRLAGYSRLATGDNFVADVVYVDPDSWLRTLVLHTGPERAETNQPVVVDRGLVGRILVSSGSYAKVLLLTDRSAAASAMIQRTRRKGIVRGAGDHLRLENIPALSDVRVGDLVVTAGLDGVFPRGLPIGRVTSVQSSQFDDAPADSLFRRITVAPAADLGLLDQVYVLTRSPLPEEVKQDLATDRLEQETEDPS
ncbi:MAG: rod shape-determining protein MreC [Thermoanaerobaculia bacterium]|nr:rod shape-determining protein MreC [Thermoanaerobaculia bacterium]